MFTMIRTACLTATAAVAATGLLLGPAAQASTPQLTGNQLESALLPTSYFPHGYKIVKHTVFSSGSRLEHSPAKYNVAALNCKKWLLGEIPYTGYGESATALEDVANGRWGYLQGVTQFASSGKALAYYRGNYTLYSRCRTVTATIGNRVTKLTTQALYHTHDGRYQAFRVIERVSLTGIPTNVNDVLITISGDDVFQMIAFGVTEPTRPTLPAAVLGLMARIMTAR